MTHLRPRGRSARSGLRAAALALGFALVLGACGGQIPFGTPRVNGAPSASAPSPAGSGAPTPAASTPVASAPASAAGSASASDGVAGTPPTTAITYQIQDAALALTLPPGWVGYDSTTPVAQIDAAARDHTELREVFDLLQSGQLSFVALDASPAGEGQPASMTIASPGRAIASGPLLRQFSEQVAQSIRSGNPVNGDVALDPVQLGSGEAYNLRWQIAREGEENLGLDAFVLSLPERTYLVTFSAPSSVVEGFAPAFRGIVDSMAPLAT
jgi:hypothetical protein